MYRFKFYWIYRSSWKNWYLGIIKSSCPWTWHISTFLRVFLWFDSSQLCILQFILFRSYTYFVTCHVFNFYLLIAGTLESDELLCIKHISCKLGLISYLFQKFSVVVSFTFFTQMILSTAKNDRCISSSSICLPFISVHYALARTYSTVLKSSGERGCLCLTPHLSVKNLSIVTHWLKIF